MKLWRENLSKVNQKAAESLADPTEYENLFPGLKEAFVVEEWVKETHADLWPAKQYPLVTVSGQGVWPRSLGVQGGNAFMTEVFELCY